MCEESLTRFDSDSDSLVNGLRGVGENAPVNDEATPVIAAPRLGLRALDHGRSLADQMKSGECKVGRFLLIEELRVGSFGHVFKAHDPRHDRIVAINAERHGRLISSEPDDRFEREARSTASLKHDGIVGLHEVGRTDDGVRFMVSEFASLTANRWRQTYRAGRLG
ncbi:MAG: hypothetical protein AB8G99_08905 [Planctomycetaceae bacterium]